MDVRIGVTFSPREIEIELADDAEPDAVKGSIEQAIADHDAVVWLTDRRGKQVGVMVDKLAYVEIGSKVDKGRIGFGG